MKPYYEHGGITIYHGDSVTITAGLGREFAVVSDPPYGMAWNTDTTRFSGGREPKRRGGVVAPRIANDSTPFDPSPWLRYPRTILWGANHYAQRLPVGATLVWVKKPAHLYGTFLSDAEIGWDSNGHGVYVCDAPFFSTDRATEVGGHGLHPTVKPLKLMAWCIERTPADLPILDPFMGSGTTLRACKDLGRKCIGIEIEEKYCEIAVRRLAQEVLPL